MKYVQKPLVFVGQNEDACFCAMIALEKDFEWIFDHFWDRFWNDFGVQTRCQKQLKILLKPFVFVGEIKDACFCAMIALETDSGSILDRFGTPKSF